MKVLGGTAALLPAAVIAKFAASETSSGTRQGNSPGESNSSGEKLELAAHHCGIRVPNLDASIAWYRDLLGFSVANRDELPGGTRFVFMKHGDFYLELFSDPSAAALPEGDYRGINHVAFVVKDLTAATEYLKRRGVEFTSPPAFGKMPPAGPKMPAKRAAFLHDPDGTLIELMDQSGLPEGIRDFGRFA
jgi:catechol 2,3-dioxygenase-like lactoylglutathione lyase family enzyme